VVIDVYDILQSKEDKATVPIYYEARLAKIDLKPDSPVTIVAPGKSVALDLAMDQSG
jgi:type I restriction enzyme R subunit